MKAIILVLLVGLPLAQFAHAEGVEIPRPKWILVATAIDILTGDKVSEVELQRADTPIEFGDPVSCGLAAIEIGPIAAKEPVAIFLVCRKVGPSEMVL